VNPYAFLPPISPHLAAREAGVAIDMDHLVRCHSELRELADVVLVEGAGGWLAPLDESRTMADLAKALNIPVLLVVGLRLGCLNHAMLTEEAILARGARLAGWVANRVDPHMRNAEDNLAYLQSHIAAPLLGVLPYHSDAHAAPQDTVSIEAFRSEMLLGKGFGVDRLG
jgi:dethiobiotin synthetase